MTARVLIVDDDRLIRHCAVSGLSSDEIKVIEAESGSRALNLISKESFHAILLDIFLQDENGLEVFRKIRALDTKVPVIFVTADTSSDTAIQAMGEGAYDYIAKPLRLDNLRQLVDSAIQSRRAMDQPVAFNIGEGLAATESFVGKSNEMVEVYKAIGRVAGQNVTVLVRGESGCGKELVARAIFQNSPRRDKPYVAVNCAAIPDQLLESELFGHEKGAFTNADRRRIGRFEQCDSGTIFLDEVGDMSPLIQGKVLRLLQEQRFERVGGNEGIVTDVRIVAATNRPLEQMVEEGKFREDLLYRLNGFTIHLPPLRERTDDIPLLLEYFLRRAKHDMKRTNLEGLAPDAFDALCRYEWPGNIRQLQSVVRQSVLNTTGTVIELSCLPSFVWAPTPPRDDKSSTATTQTDQQLDSSHSSANVSLNKNVDSDDPSDITVQRTESDAHSESHPNLDSSAYDPDRFDIESFIEHRVREGSQDLYAELITEVEKILFPRILAITAGNQSKAADILGITRGKIRDRIAAFGIQFEKNVSIADS